MKFRFAYTGIRVTDLERSLKFYRDGLGLRECGRGKMSHGGVFVELSDDNTEQKLELNWYPPDSAFNVPFQPGDGLDHLAFEVEDVDEAFKMLISSFGAKPAIEPWTDEPGNERSRIGFVTDPDGNWIELIRG
ncbi:MAG: VOC family protein [Thermoplasmata archaeon]|uniref:VOC family protein n=1 Tax=Candidatus Sysuiplasma superficiale TaxID=2823368 RepID=A0A8J7YQ59_9ARCH|nr:VOC family protein [Candidatus Sysuiplasma superficiale]MBX8643126.1 VOC family protein [Candidatus Sysuiplasma superficiale]MCL4346941.1 VOC family protein [Candidatus Thermoplasmatota archaeon]